MDDRERGGSGGTVAIVIAIVAVVLMIIPCLGGVFLFGMLSFRSVSVPMSAPVAVPLQPMPVQTIPEPDTTVNPESDAPVDLAPATTSEEADTPAPPSGETTSPLEVPEPGN